MDDAMIGNAVRAASAALGSRLSDPVALSEGHWTLVLRCRRVEAGDSVIVKVYPRADDGWRFPSCSASWVPFRSMSAK